MCVHERSVGSGVTGVPLVRTLVRDCGLALQRLRELAWSRDRATGRDA